LIPPWKPLVCEVGYLKVSEKGKIGWKGSLARKEEGKERK